MSQVTHNPEGRWKPWSPGGRVSDQLKSATAKAARKLFDEWMAAEEYVRTRNREYDEAVARVREAREALAAAQAREVETRGAEPALPAARALADAEVELVARGTGEMGTKAKEAAAGAKAVLEEYLDNHSGELLEEARPLAEQLQKQWLAAESEFEKAVEGLRDQHDDLCATLAFAIGRLEPFTPNDLPRTKRETSGYERPALPSSESLERRAKFEVDEAERVRQYQLQLDRENAERQKREAEEAATGGPQRYRPLTRAA